MKELLRPNRSDPFLIETQYGQADWFVLRAPVTKKTKAQGRVQRDCSQLRSLRSVGKNVAILGQVRFTHDGKSMQVAQWPKGFKS